MSYAASHPQYRELDIGDGLRLVEPRTKHAAESLTWVSAPDVVAYMGADFSNPTLEGERKRIEEVLQNKDEYSWMIELRGNIIGNSAINNIKASTEKFGVKAGNLVILIGDTHAWGKGIGTSVCRAILDWAFNEAEFEAMGARALQENAACIRTLQKLGFQEIGSEPFEGTVSGGASVWRIFRYDLNPIGESRGEEINFRSDTLH